VVARGNSDDAPSLKNADLGDGCETGHNADEAQIDDRPHTW